MVFLAAQPANLRARIRKRGREQEKELLSPENPYLEEIADLYEAWYSNWAGEKFRVQTDSLTEDEVVSRIGEELRAREVTVNRRIREPREVPG
jgi:deoxyadenosine/deoxycytidine kinase